LNARNDLVVRRLVVLDETLQVCHSSELRREASPPARTTRVNSGQHRHEDARFAVQAGGYRSAKTRYA
jgi:hypothetical protein